MTCFIITGAPCTGKSSLIEHFQSMGIPCKEEIARQVIKKSLAQGSNALPWQDNFSFSTLVLAVMKDQNSNWEHSMGFVDRGIPDLEAYLKLSGHPLPQGYSEALKVAPYAKTVFLCPPVKEWYQNDAERKEDFSQALAIHESLKTCYLDRGFQIIEVPLLSVEQRCQWILDQVSSI